MTPTHTRSRLSAAADAAAVGRLSMLEKGFQEDHARAERRFLKQAGVGRFGEAEEITDVNRVGVDGGKG